MTDNNYTKYSNFSKPQDVPVVDPEVKSEVEPGAVNTVYEADGITPAHPVVTPTAPETALTVEDDELIGVVTDCVKLNVRKVPAADAEIITKIPLGTEVKIDILESTNDFYKVCTGAGIEGYCAKDYINID